MEAKFEEDYPGVDVILIPSTNETEFTQTISTTLNTSPDDIYICHNIPYERLSVNNLVMNLDTLYNSVIYTDTKNTESTDDDTPVRFVDRVATSSLNLVRFNGHYVAIPEIQGVGGIAYNKTLFDANGWEIPETYEELAALAETIYTGDYKNAEGEKVYPFVWSGTVAYMWDSFVYDMWVQIAGIDEFNTFMKYESKDLFDSSKYPALKQAWTYWYNLICAHQEYSHPQSLGFDHLQANTAFAAGQAAMMPGLLLDGERNRLRHSGSIRYGCGAYSHAFRERSSKGQRRQSDPRCLRYGGQRRHDYRPERKEQTGRRGIFQMDGDRGKRTSFPREY